VDNRASKHMTRFKQNLVNYRDKKFNVKVELGDDGTYAIKGLDQHPFSFSQVMYFILNKFFMFLDERKILDQL
jgi:restriction endonuclease S subunit